jgi:Putative ATPase subunit of terminase (gpP-like)
MDSAMTERTSLRRAARAQFRALAEAQPRAVAPEAGLTANPTPLTTEVQSLYEAGVVPVREIARMAGVTERTVYKYAERGGWKRRYARRNPRGAGGRFVVAEDEGKPHAAGLKALDPDGAQAAAATCARAGALADAAMAEARARAAQARADKAAEARVRTLESLGKTFSALLKALPEDDSPSAGEAFALAERIGCAILTAMGQALARPRPIADAAPGSMLETMIGDDGAPAPQAD